MYAKELIANEQFGDLINELIEWTGGAEEAAWVVRDNDSVPSRILAALDRGVLNLTVDYPDDAKRATLVGSLASWDQVNFGLNINAEAVGNELRTGAFLYEPKLDVKIDRPDWRSRVATSAFDDFARAVTKQRR